MPSITPFAALWCIVLADSTDARRSKCEQPTVPSPRSTSCQVWKPPVLERWHAFHAALASETAAYRSPSGRPSLLLVGDSITEAFRGTAIGEVQDRTRGINATLSTLARDYQVQVNAISGDETQHLLWRLDNGELGSPSLRADPHLHMVLLIGTNNLGNAKHSAEATVAGVLAAARALLSRTQGRLLVQMLLPRGEGPKHRAWRLKHPSGAFMQMASLMPAVTRCNSLLAAGVDRELASAFPGRVRRVDCGRLFATAIPGREVSPTLMPDDLHPNVEGSRLLANCVRDALARWRREDAAGVHSAPGTVPLMEL